MSRNGNKNFDFEVNLMPVISILAVVISILLLTAVWINVGAFSLNQALGTETQENQKSPPSLWVQFEDDGDLRLLLKDAEVSDKIAASTIREKSSEKRLTALQSYAQNARKLLPELKVALILPAPSSSYQDIIAVMDVLKKEQISDLGVAPL